MKRLLRAAALALATYSLSSCYNLQRSVIASSVTQLPCFTLSLTDDYAYVTLNENKETYCINREIYQFVDDRLKPEDREKLEKTNLIGQVLEIVDVFRDHSIDRWDVAALALQKGRVKKLKDLVNSQYPADKPRLEY